MPIKGLNYNGIPLSLSKALSLEDFDLEKNHNEIKFRPGRGSGKILINQFNLDFITVEADITPNLDIELNLEFINSDFLLFLFNTKGESLMSFEKPNVKKNIGQFNSISVFTEHNQIKSLACKKNEHLIIDVLCISKKTFLRVCENFSQMDISNSKLVKVVEKLESNIYKMNFGYNIVEELKKIKSLNDSEVNMKYLKIKARYQLVLAFHLEELYKGLFEEKLQIGLSAAELKIINQVADHIFENPGLNHLQSKLCKDFFISQSKLQQGFKLMHKTTVSNFTKVVRLKKAEELMKTGQLNISEIVYSVGFTSRSYFSKIFKQYYGISPTEYRAKIHDQKLIII